MEYEQEEEKREGRRCCVVHSTQLLLTNRSIIMSVLSPWIMIPWIQFTGQQLAVMRRNRHFGWFGLRSERYGPSREYGTCALFDLDFQRELFALSFPQHHHYGILNASIQCSCHLSVSQFPFACSHITMMSSLHPNSFRKSRKRHGCIVKYGRRCLEKGF